jgi:hypothetical protein
MKCVKCGREFSDKVYRVHRGRCNGIQEKQEEKTETTAIEIADFDKDDLIDYAEGMGLEIDRRWGKARLVEAIQENM